MAHFGPEPLVNNQAARLSSDLRTSSTIYSPSVDRIVN